MDLQNLRLFRAREQYMPALASALFDAAHPALRCSPRWIRPVPCGMTSVVHYVAEMCGGSWSTTAAVRCKRRNAACPSWERRNLPFASAFALPLSLCPCKGGPSPVWSFGGSSHLWRAQGRGETKCGGIGRLASRNLVRL